MSLPFKYRTIYEQGESPRHEESFMREDEFKLVCYEMYTVTKKEFLRMCDKLSDKVAKIEDNVNLTLEDQENYIRDLVNETQIKSQNLWERYHKRLDNFTDDYKHGRIVIDYCIAKVNLSMFT